MPNLSEECGVYAYGKEIPDFRITRDEARNWVLQGLARWMNKARDIRLSKRPNEIYRPDESLTMGPRVMEKVADGNRYYLDMLQGWKGL